MRTFGIIFCAHQSESFIAPGPTSSIQPWIDLRAKSGEHRFVIVAVCVPFEGFVQDSPPDRTEALLRERLERGHIDHLVTSATPIKETDARGEALQWLVRTGADTVWQADSDEMITEQQILRIAAFWTYRSHLCWARLSYKNRVFTPDQYLVAPFTPMRLHRVRVHAQPFGCPVPTNYGVHSFYDDNNVIYRQDPIVSMPATCFDGELAGTTIPPAVAWIDHWTWLSDERSRRKIVYQNSRPGWKCDFDWDDSRGGLIWRDGVTPQETARDN